VSASQVAWYLSMAAAGRPQDNESGLIQDMAPVAGGMDEEGSAEHVTTPTAPLLGSSTHPDPEITCVCSVEEEAKILTGWPRISLMSKVQCCCQGS
jgi:hypothetical protein